MNRIVRAVGYFLFPTEDRLSRWAKGPPETRFARKLAVLWALFIVQVAIFGLVISSQIVGCPTKRDSCHAAGKTMARSDCAER